MARKNRSSKRFGSRYGSRIRKNVDEAESRDAECPECGSSEVKRTAAGIWECQKCGNKAAGGAYRMDTGAKEMLKKALQTEVAVEELEEAKDEIEGEE
ncbi:MAG: 50S ribosomal protein L37ae [Candidatus Nanohaloarchaea archaeon]